MKHENYTQNAIQGPYTPTKPTRADQVLLWLSGFALGFVTALICTGN